MTLNAGWNELPPFAVQRCDLRSQFPVCANLFQRDGCVLLMHASALRDAEQHAAQSSGMEVIGILCGTAWCDVEHRYAAVCDRVVPLPGAEASARHVRMTEVSWRAAWTQLRAEEQVVGWYHSHPGYGVFFSDTDRRTQRQFFAETWQCGLVLDPQRGEMLAVHGAHSGPCIVHVVHPD